MQKSCKNKFANYSTVFMYSLFGGGLTISSPNTAFLSYFSFLFPTLFDEVMQHIYNTAGFICYNLPSMLVPPTFWLIFKYLPTLWLTLCNLYFCRF